METASQNLQGTKTSSPRLLLSLKPHVPSRRASAGSALSPSGVTSHLLFPFPFHRDSSLSSAFSHSFFSFSSPTPNAKPAWKLLESLQPRSAQFLPSKQKNSRLSPRLPFPAARARGKWSEPLNATSSESAKHLHPKHPGNGSMELRLRVKKCSPEKVLCV